MGLQDIIPVPDVPAFIKGVINLRGKVVPVMDVRRRFRLPEREYNERTVIIVLEDRDSTTGLVVDSVNDVVEILPAQIDPAPRVHGTESSGLVRGMGRRGDAVVILIDVQRLLSAEKIDASLLQAARSAQAAPAAAPAPES